MLTNGLLSELEGREGEEGGREEEVEADDWVREELVSTFFCFVWTCQ